MYRKLGRDPEHGAWSGEFGAGSWKLEQIQSSDSRLLTSHFPRSRKRNIPFN